MLDSTKVSLIHVAKSQLKLSEIAYRDILVSFNVSTSKELNDAQFNQLMKIFKDMGFVSMNPKVRADLKRNAKDIDESIKMATNAQIGMIRGLWQSKARYPNDEALEWFVYRIVKKISLNVLTHQDIEKIKKAIDSL